MRIAAAAILLALAVTAPAFTAPALAQSEPSPATGPAPGRARVASQRPAQATPRPVVARPIVARPIVARTASNAPAAIRPVSAHPVSARSRGWARGGATAHPGLGDTDFNAAIADAQGFCGQMQMPAAALREVSRGFRRGHTGIDLMAPHGSPIHAAAAGSVIYAGWYYAYGNIVDIRHADGVVTRYAHMSAFAQETTPGALVRAGDEIGKVGATGHASGPHVHFEVRLGGRPVDPKPYLALASCDGASPGTEILEAYADERPATARRPASNTAASNTAASNTAVSNATRRVRQASHQPLQLQPFQP